MTITTRARTAAQKCEEIQRFKQQGFYSVTKTPAQVWDLRSSIVQTAIDEAVAEAVKPIQDECAALRGHKVGNEAEIIRLRTLNDNQRHNIEVYQKRETELTGEIANLKQVKSELSSLLDSATQPSTTWIRMSPDTMIDSGTYHRALYKFIQKQQENNGKEQLQLAETLDLLQKTDQRLNDVGDHMVKMRKELEEAKHRNSLLESQLNVYRDIDSATIMDSVFSIMRPKPSIDQQEAMRSDTIIHVIKSREGASGYYAFPPGVKMCFRKDLEKFTVEEPESIDPAIAGMRRPVSSVPRPVRLGRTGHWLKTVTKPAVLEVWLNNPTIYAREIRQFIFGLIWQKAASQKWRIRYEKCLEINQELRKALINPYVVPPSAQLYDRDRILAEVTMMGANGTLTEGFINDIISRHCSMWIRK